MDESGIDFGATTPLIRPGGHTTQFRPPQADQPRRPAPPPAPPKRRIPIWAWILGAGGLLMLALVAAVLIYFLFSQPGFSAVVRGAPPGSDVFVDNISRGVTSADGSINVTGLKAGKRVLRVSHEGYTDFNTTVSGKDGEVKTIVAQLVSTTEAPAGMPKEIDYKGPMLLVGAGEFIMGDDKHNPDEKPAHPVTLPDFYMDKFEVTNEQYKQFCDASKHAYPTNPWWDDQYFATQPRSPVLGVSWDDASAYANWAGKRLPKEEEWEKAASWDPTKKIKRQWPWGDTSDPSLANVGGARTTPVGQFSGGASFYGVQDLAGNVAEWVDAFYQPYPGNTTPDPNFGTKNRAVRGGTYHGDLDDARATRRLRHPPQFNEAEKKNRAFLIGFRSAIAADDPRIQNLLRQQK